jgi:hypothetical protein
MFAAPLSGSPRCHHGPMPSEASESDVPLVEVLGAVSLATDLGNGETPFHAVRSAVLAVALGRELGVQRLRAAGPDFQATYRRHWPMVGRGIAGSPAAIAGCATAECSTTTPGYACESPQSICAACPPSSCSTACTTAPHDQHAGPAATDNGSLGSVIGAHRVVQVGTECQPDRVDGRAASKSLRQGLELGG